MVVARGLWALGRTRETVEKAIAGSRTMGVYRDRGDGMPGEQVAFARAVTDGATFAWVCDVFVDSDVRGLGVGNAMVGPLVTALEDLGIGRVLLATRDAHEVYAGSVSSRWPIRRSGWNATVDRSGSCQGLPPVDPVPADLPPADPRAGDPPPGDPPRVGSDAAVASGRHTVGAWLWTSPTGTSSRRSTSPPPSGWGSWG